MYLKVLNQLHYHCGLSIHDYVSKANADLYSKYKNLKNGQTIHVWCIFLLESCLDFSHFNFLRWTRNISHKVEDNFRWILETFWKVKCISRERLSTSPLERYIRLSLSLSPYIYIVTLAFLLLSDCKLIVTLWSYIVNIDQLPWNFLFFPLGLWSLIVIL